MELYTIPVLAPEQPDMFILYRPLLGLAFIGNAAMVTLARSLAHDPARPAREDVRNFLEEIGFFRPDPDPPQLPQPGPFAPTGLALLMTNQCQLRCTYCYAGAGDFPRQSLALATGYAAIDYTFASLQRLEHPKFAISLHGGGEPTFPWKTLKALVAYARAKPIRTEFSLTSNGIWSEQQTRWIMAYIDGVGISMDGSPGTQDLQRPMASGKGSSAWVLRAMHEMEAHGYSFGVRLTAVPPFDRLLEDIRYLCENTRCAHMQVEAAFNTRRGEERQPELAEGLAFLRAFLAAQDLAEQHGRALGCSGSDVDHIAPVSCSSPINTMVVAPQGNMVGCFEVVNDQHPMAQLATIGRITPQGVEIDEEARARLRQRIEERRESCRDCFCYWNCAGDCLIRSFTANPENHLEHGPRCELNRALLREMLLKRIAAGNGIWKRAAGLQNGARCAVAPQLPQDAPPSGVPYGP